MQGFFEEIALVLADLKRRKTDKYNKRKQELTQQVTEEVSAEPVYVAKSAFRGKPHESVPEELIGRRLSSDEIVRLMGGDRAVLNKHFGFMYGSSNTVPADYVADFRKLVEEEVQ